MFVGSGVTNNDVMAEDNMKDGWFKMQSKSGSKFILSMCLHGAVLKLQLIVCSQYYFLGGFILLF